MKMSKQELLEELAEILIPEPIQEDEFTMANLLEFFASKGEPMRRNQVHHRVERLLNEGHLTSRKTNVNGRQVTAYRFVKK